MGRQAVGLLPPVRRSDSVDTCMMSVCVLCLCRPAAVLRAPAHGRRDGGGADSAAKARDGVALQVRRQHCFAAFLPPPSRGLPKGCPPPAQRAAPLPPKGLPSRPKAARHCGASRGVPLLPRRAFALQAGHPLRRAGRHALCLPAGQPARGPGPRMCTRHHEGFADGLQSPRLEDPGRTRGSRRASRLGMRAVPSLCRTWTWWRRSTRSPSSWCRTSRAALRRRTRSR